MLLEKLVQNFGARAEVCLAKPRDGFAQVNQSPFSAFVEDSKRSEHRNVPALRFPKGFRFIDHQGNAEFFGQENRVSLTPAELLQPFIRQELGLTGFKPTRRVLNPPAHAIGSGGISKLIRDSDRNYHSLMRAGRISISSIRSR
jgi:hypothetical protein